MPTIETCFKYSNCIGTRSSDAKKIKDDSKTREIQNLRESSRYPLPRARGGGRKRGSPIDGASACAEEENFLNKCVIKVIVNRKTVFFTLGFRVIITFFVQYSQSDLPPLRPLCGEAPGLEIRTRDGRI